MCVSRGNPRGHRPAGAGEEALRPAALSPGRQVSAARPLAMPAGPRSLQAGLGWGNACGSVTGPA